MVSWLEDPYGYSIGLIKPVEFPSQSLPDIETIHKFTGEGESAFSWVSGKINHLMKMFDFTPDYMSKLFGGVEITDADYKQFGNAKADLFKLDETVTNNHGDPWATDWDSRGFENEMFGYSHPISSGSQMWGAGAGVPGKKNLNYDPSVSDKILFKKSGSGDILDDWMDDPTAFKETVDPENLSENFGDYRLYSNSADMSNLLSSFGSKNYYEIVMSGMNATNIAYVDDGKGGQKIDYNATQSQFGTFDYDGLSDYQAFLMVVDMTQKRREIVGTMSELFAPTSLIYNNGGAPDDQAIIKNMQSWLSDPKKGGGASHENLAWFDVALKMQHYFHGVDAAYSGGTGYEYNVLPASNDWNGLGDKGFNGFLRDAQDMVAFKKFRNFIRTKADAYINSLEDGSNARAIFNEFTFQGYNLPYASGDDARDAHVGWDFYSNAYDQDKAPENLNPYANDPHKFYAISQLNKLSESQVEGRSLVDGKNLYQTNWVVYAAGKFSTFRKDAMNNVNSVMFQNFNNRRTFKIRTIQYNDKVEDVKDKVYDQKREDAKAAAKAHSKHKSEEQKLSMQANRTKKQHASHSKDKPSRINSEKSRFNDNKQNKAPVAGKKKS